MKHNDFKELLVLYSYNELEAADVKKLEEHLRTCDSCIKEFEELKDLNRLFSEHMSSEPDEDLLFESREELQIQIRRWQREKSRQTSSAKLFQLVPASGWKMAIAASIAIVTLTVLYFSVMQKAPVMNVPEYSTNTSSGNAAKTAPSDINDNIAANDKPADHENTATPVSETRNNASVETERILVHSLIKSENPGVRLKTASAILSKSHLLATRDMKGALIQSLKSDPNPGVRKVAMNALGKLPFDREISAALMQVLAHDKNSGLRIMAINYLDKGIKSEAVTDSVALSILKKKTEEKENSYIQLRAKSILQRIKT